MTKEGYDRSYAAGITAGSSLIGPIIPPSIFMVLYGTMTNQSIGGLFVAGVIPGLLLGVAFMVMNYYYSIKYNYPAASQRASLKEIGSTFGSSLVALVAPIIIIGGILSGVVTPTEAGAVAILYTVIVGFFITRELTVKSFIEALFESVRNTSVIFMIMGSATVISWLLKWEQVPQKFASFLIGVTDNSTVLLLILSSLIFIIGMFMEEIAALVLLTPVIAPVAIMSGIDPLHFGIVMTLNITIALITPPMGACVYIVSAVGKVKLEKLFKDIWPFVLVAMIVLLLIIFFDLTIVDDQGKMLNMGTGFDQTEQKALTSYYEELLIKGELSSEEKEILDNRRLLYHLMSRAGFTNYPLEWWHYDFGNQSWAWMHQDSRLACYGGSSPYFRWRDDDLNQATETDYISGIK